MKIINDHRGANKRREANIREEKIRYGRKCEDKIRESMRGANMIIEYK